MEEIRFGDNPVHWFAHLSDRRLYFDDFEFSGSARWDWIVSNTDFLWYLTCYTQFPEVVQWVPK